MRCKLHTTDNTVYATTKPGSRRPAEGRGCCGVSYTLQTTRCMLQQNQGQEVLLKEVVVAVYATHYRQYGVCYTLQTIRCILQQNQGQDVLLKEVVVTVHAMHYRQRMIVCLPLPVTHHSWVNQYNIIPPPPICPHLPAPSSPHPAVPLSHTIHHHHHPSGSTIWLLPNIYTRL